MTATLRLLTPAALVAMCILGCTRGAPTVNARFVPTTVGVVRSTDQVVVDGKNHVQYHLADGQVVDVVAGDLAPFGAALAEPDYLLLKGHNESDWILLATPANGERGCHTLGFYAFDRGSTVEIEVDPSRGWYLVVPKAPGYADHGSDANGILQQFNCLDDQGRALGPDGS